MPPRGAACHTVDVRLLVDSASLYYRSYYALPESMTAPNGLPHNAIRGFLSTMAKLVRQHGADELVCAWDADWRPQWRVDLLPSYKAHRVAETNPIGDPEPGHPEADGPGPGEAEETPDSLAPQVDALAGILDAMGIARPRAAGFEADDVLATLSTTLEGPALVVSGDRDLVQLVDERVGLVLTVNGGMDKWPVLDPAGVIERFGVPAHRYVDLAVLRGDPSDGLPGVPGIGAKTAIALVSQWPDLEAMVQAAANPRPPLTGKRAQAMLDSAGYLRAARVVATAVRTVEFAGDPLARQPDRALLDERAAHWGVTRQVADLEQALASA